MVSRKVGRSAVESFQHLINIIVECKKQSEIVKVFKIRKHNTWINDEVLQMIKQRDKLYKEKVKNPNNIAFKAIKNKVNNKIKVLKSQYFRNKWEQAGNDVRKQWKFVNSYIGNNNESSIKSLKISGIEIISIPEMADSFNQHFSRVGSTILEQL